MILLLALMHAWFGHDYLHGHHHLELGEAAYSSPSADSKCPPVPPALTPAWPTFPYESALPVLEVIELIPLEQADYADPGYSCPKQVPRPPPSFSPRS